MLDYRIVLADPQTGTRWDQKVSGEDREAVIHEARRTFATHFVSYEDYVPDNGTKGIGTESDYMDTLVRLGARFDLVACIDLKRDPRGGFNPGAITEDIEVCETMMPASAPPGVLTGQIEAKTPLLVLVHPGSLMGSYESHYSAADDGDKAGMAMPEEMRDAIAKEILEFQGDKAAIFGDFTDEIVAPDGKSLSRAIDSICHEGAVLYAWPYDNELGAAATWLVRHFRASERPYVLVTGAWTDLSDGCAHEIATALATAGATVRMSRHAPWLMHAPQFPVDLPEESA